MVSRRRWTRDGPEGELVRALGVVENAPFQRGRPASRIFAGSSPPFWKKPPHPVRRHVRQENPHEPRSPQTPPPRGAASRVNAPRRARFRRSRPRRPAGPRRRESPQVARLATPPLATICASCFAHTSADQATQFGRAGCRPLSRRLLVPAQSLGVPGPGLVQAPPRPRGGWGGWGGGGGAVSRGRPPGTPGRRGRRDPLRVPGDDERTQSRVFQRRGADVTRRSRAERAGQRSLSLIRRTSPPAPERATTSASSRFRPAAERPSSPTQVDPGRPGPLPVQRGLHRSPYWPPLPATAWPSLTACPRDATRAAGSVPGHEAPQPFGQDRGTRVAHFSGVALCRCQRSLLGLRGERLALLAHEISAPPWRLFGIRVTAAHRVHEVEPACPGRCRAQHRSSRAWLRVPAICGSTPARGAPPARQPPQPSVQTRRAAPPRTALHAEHMPRPGGRARAAGDHLVTAVPRAARPMQRRERRRRRARAAPSYKEKNSPHACSLRHLDPRPTLSSAQLRRAQFPDP